MSTPTFTGLTSMDACDVNTNLGAFGTNSNKYAIDTEVYFEGTGAYVTKFNTVGLGGAGDQAVGSVDMSTNLFIGWCWFASWPMYDTFANGGFRVRLCEGSSWTANYKEWVCGGQDSPFIRAGGWRLVALDSNRTADTSSGTFDATPLATTEYAGYTHLPNQTAAQSPSFGMDNLWYGTELEVTGPSFTDATNGIDLNDNGGSADTIVRQDGGSFVTDGWEVDDWVKIVSATTSGNDGEYEITAVSASTLTLSTGDLAGTDADDTGVKIYCSVTFEDIVNWDEDETNNTAALKGVVTKDAGSGAYVINYPLRLGDASGSNSLYFRSTGDAIVFADQPLNTTRVDFIEVVEDTGETYIQFGGAGLSGSTISSAETIFSTKSPAAMDLSASDVTEIKFQGITISNVDKAIDLASVAAHSYTQCTFAACGTITLGSSGTFQSNTIIASTATSACSASSLEDVDDCSFISGGTGHAVDRGTVSTSVTESWNCTTSGYAAGATGNPVTEDDSTEADILVSVSASQKLTINVSSGATIPSIKNTGTGTVAVNQSVTLTITVKDKDGTEIQDAQVAVFPTAGGTALMNEDTNASGIATESYGGTTPVEVAVRIRKGSTGATKYKNYSSVQNVTSSGLTLDVTLIEDPNNAT